MDTVADGWSGFATHDESEYPELWDGCVAAHAPCLGPSGMALYDWSGASRHGTLTNMEPATDWIVSNGRSALDFDGTNEKVVTSQTIPAINDGTICAWVILRTTSTYRRVLDTVYNTGFLLSAGPASTLGGGFKASGSPFGAYASVSLNTLYHVCVTRVGTLNTCYINGVSSATYTGSSGATTAAVMNFGSSGSTDYANIILLDSAVFSRALSVNEIVLMATRPGIAYEPRPRRRRAGVTAAAATRRHLMLLGVGR